LARIARLDEIPFVSGMGSVLFKKRYITNEITLALLHEVEM